MKFNLIYFDNNSILYSKKYHLYFNPIHLYSEDDLKRILLDKNKYLSNPKYLFVSLYSSSKNKVKFGIYDKSKIKYKWRFNNMNIISHNNLYLNIRNNKLIVSKHKSQWEIISNNGKYYFKNTKIKDSDNVFIGCDLEYNLILTNKIEYAINFNINNHSIHYIKPSIRINFEMNNIIRKKDYDNIIKDSNNEKINIGILLAAGTSSRFESNTSKQLYKINSIPIITYSINNMKNILDKIIIVTNTKCYEEIKNIINDDINIKIVINDINCRLESLSKGLEYIKINYNNIDKIIIHDSARPYLLEDHFKNLLNTNHLYSQYYLKLVNGLAKKELSNYEIVNRDDYIEICTPICINFKLCYFIFKNYMDIKNRITYEFIPILDLLKIKYKFIEDSYKYLRKITIKDDL